jgi:hypothetical protein
MKRVLGIYQREALELVIERGRNRSDSHDGTFLPEKLADGATALQTAMVEHIRRGHRGNGPFRSAQELQDAGSASVLPDGRVQRVSRNLFEAVVQQPTQVDGRLGPIVAAATRTIGEAVHGGLLFPPASIMTVTRTIERRHLRPSVTIGGRTGGRQDHGVVVGPIATVGGGSFSFASHLPTQDRGDVPGDLLNYHETRTKVELNPLTARMSVQSGVWLDLNETLGISLPIVNRGERRFAPAGEQIGLETSDELWYPAEQATWFDDVARFFPPDALVLGEVPLSWLQGMTYKSNLGERSIGNPQHFVEEVELKLRMLQVRTIDKSGMAARGDLVGADEVVTLEGDLIAPDGSEYKPVFVISGPHAKSTVYVIPADRAAGMEAITWESVLLALAALHGPASSLSSDDQGRGLSLPLERGATITSSHADKAGNYDVLRFFGHALETRSHWRQDGAAGA